MFFKGSGTFGPTKDHSSFHWYENVHAIGVVYKTELDTELHTGKCFDYSQQQNEKLRTKIKYVPL